MNRRQFLKFASALGGSAVAQALLPPWARSAWAVGSDPTADPLARPSLETAESFLLKVAESSWEIEGRTGRAVTLNGTIPGPLLRWREGTEVTLDVDNRLGEDTSIHWHGILLPPEMDGVPGVSFAGIPGRETFRYRFPVLQSGTYWYHSHSGFQEQLGHYGPLLIDPAGADPIGSDREIVIVLADWTFENPRRVFAKLKKVSHAYDYQKLTVRDLFRRARNDGWGEALRERAMWGSMRMSPTDLADVTGATYTYLINGHGPEDDWTALFEPGERLRLRIINASAMSIFNVRIPGLPMTVVQSDGLPVRPMTVDEFQIGTAETYDVVVQTSEHRAYTLMCESIDRSGFARATLTPELGLRAEVPELRERPLLTMGDMGMEHHGAHGAHDGGTEAPEEQGGHGSHEAMDHGSMNHDDKDHGDMDHAGMHHEGMNHGAMGHAGMDAHEHGEAAGGGSAWPTEPTARQPVERGPGVANVAETPRNRLHEPGIGLEDVAHRTLSYADLESLDTNPDTRPPERELELHLTSNMERYMWSFDGVKLSENPEPIVFHEGERLRLTMVNNTMMPHPIHLHGMFFEVVNGKGSRQPRKHTIIVKPAEKLSLDVTADAVGDWAFHCHLLYHMHAGMMRVVSVRPRTSEPAAREEA